LAQAQHWAVARRQLVALGFSDQAIHHRLGNGRLHRTPWRGVYAIGRSELGRHGTWMAALLACGEGAVLSHRSAAELWGIVVARRPMGAGEAEGQIPATGGRNVGAAGEVGGAIHVSVPAGRRRRLAGIRAHRRLNLGPGEVTAHERIPVTAPIRTILDLAVHSTPKQLEAVINEADKLNLVDPEALLSALDECPRQQGVSIVRRLLDRLTFTFTDTELERRFLPLARDAGLPPPRTQQWVNGHRVDFYWPELGLVVETDGLRYHRTAGQQTTDRRRDQDHAAAGLTPLRFSHAQVAFEREHVRATLRRVAARLGGGP
jgi:very-short-patch-repair endonuclease